MSFGVFHNWPDRYRSSPMPRRGTKSKLSPAELDKRIRELHARRHEMLDRASERDLTPGEVRFVKHILRELDWYEVLDAEPMFRGMEERTRSLRALARKVNALARKFKKATTVYEKAKPNG